MQSKTKLKLASATVLVFSTLVLVQSVIDFRRYGWGFRDMLTVWGLVPLLGTMLLASFRVVAYVVHK